MFGRKRLINIGLFVGIVGLVALFPARVGYQWFAPPQLVMSGISGTVWNGQAREATVDGFYLRDLDWRMRPLQLFTAKLGFSLESRFISGFVEGDFAIGIGSVRASDLRATLPLEVLQSALMLPGVRGSVTADISEVQMRDGIPIVADGSLEVAGLTIPFVQRDPIGGFKADLFTTETGVSASIEDTAAVIDLAGSVQLANDGAYDLSAQIGVLENTPAQLREQLRFTGPVNDRGQHEIRLAGKL